MLRFKQFLIEGIVDWYHRTDPATAERLKKGEKIFPTGLSIWTNPEKAEAYTFDSSAGHIPKNAVTLTGSVSNRRILPDIEFHPEAYKSLFVKIAKNIESDPNYRVPTITTSAQPPNQKALTFNTPGLITEIDPETGRKKLARGWEPRFRVVGEKFQTPKPLSLSAFPVKFEETLGNPEMVNIDDPRVKPVIKDRRSNTIGGDNWGGRGTVGSQTYIDPSTGATKEGVFGFKETRHLDVLANKGELNDITNKALKQGVKAFRTKSGSGVNVSGIVDPTQAIKSTGKAVGKTALKMLPVVGTAASLAAMTQRAQAGDYVGAGLEAASEVADYIPAVGTAASMGIQAYLADRDTPEEEKKKQKSNLARQNLRSLAQGIQ